MFSLSLQPMQPETLHNGLADATAGAVVTFEGRVRRQNEGREVQSLEYEAYPALAEKEGQRVLQEAVTRWPLAQACAVHRVGRLAIGDLAVWVGVASAHRAEAFEACRYIIDQLKVRVPIWKKEHYTDGDSTWINCATGEERS